MGEKNIVASKGRSLDHSSDAERQKVRWLIATVTGKKNTFFVTRLTVRDRERWLTWRATGNTNTVSVTSLTYRHVDTVCHFELKLAMADF